MNKRITLEKFADYTLTEGKYPTLDTFMSWGFGRSTYYKVKNRYEEIHRRFIMVNRAEIQETLYDAQPEAFGKKEVKEIYEILNNPFYLRDYDIFDNWMKEHFSSTGKEGFLCD